MYPEEFVAPMREELTRLGFQEMRTSAEVDSVLGSAKGTAMLVVNSICGCAAGKARPAVALALENRERPDVLATVFAGQDADATSRARSYITGYGPSSPSIALFKDGKTVFMLERSQIEGRPAEAIAEDLAAAFNTFCVHAQSTPA